MARISLTTLSLLCFTLGSIDTAHADRRRRFDAHLEVRASKIAHRGHDLSVDLDQLRALVDLSYGKRVRLHLVPIIGVANAQLTIRDKVRRTVSAKALKATITDAHGKVPRKLSVPTEGIGAPPGLLPPTIDFPIDHIEDPGADIPDKVSLSVPFYADLTLPWTPVAGFRTSFELLPRTRFRIEPFLEYQHTMRGTEPKIDALIADVEGIGLDISFMRDTIAMTNQWSLLTAGLRLGYDARHCHMYMDAGVLRIRDTYSIGLRDELKRKLDDMKIDTSEKKSLTDNQPYIALGAVIPLDERAAVRTEASAIRTAHSASFYGSLGLIFHIGP